MKEWKSGCKRCGLDLVNYSDRSYTHSLQFGFSRPEYCPDCQKEEVLSRNDLGTPYFSVIVGNLSNAETVFGELNHPGRNHQVTETEGEFDETRYGLTPDKIKELADWFKNQQHRVAIVVGPTGSGKSTALPYWMLFPPENIGVEPDFFTRDGQIVHTQPRIIAADGQADYIGQVLMGGHVGAGFDIGLHYGQNNESDWRNVLVPKTDGIFINEIIQGDIGKYGYVIIDEAHERSLNIDKILCLLKERLPFYPKLKIIIASATIDPQIFVDFFGNEVAGIIEFEGKDRVDKNHNPVSYKVFYQGDLGEKTEFLYTNLLKLGKIIVNAAVEKSIWLVNEIISGKKDKGDILVFLQGVKPIDDAVAKAKSFLERDGLNSLVEVFPLYRDLPNEEKEKITKHDLDDGKIWIIFSTNIAEASVTIDSLGYEIETGIENQSIFDANTESTTVPLTLISKANCKQRWGRTGRTRNGEVYCIYTKDQFDSLFLEYPVSAIKRSSMEELLLDMKSAGISNPTIGWLENPEAKEMERSKDALIKIGALLPQGNLSNKGLLLLNLPYPANLVEILLLADEHGCLVEMISVLPVIKNGGKRKLLNWKCDWEQYIKYNAFQHHQALMSGSRDDVDFIIKIIECWDNKSSDEFRKNWAEQNFINIETIQIVITERNGLLDYFYQQSGEGVRKIDLTLLPRVRSILSLVFPEVKNSTQSDLYQYDQVSKPQDQSQINCQCISTDQVDTDWMTINKYICEPNESLYSRLMVDQLYPINSILLITKSPEGVWKPNDTEQNQDIAISVYLQEDQKINPTKSAEVRVVGYSFEKIPTILVNIVNPPEPFDLFFEKYKIGEYVEVEVLEILNYPNDGNPVLISKELITQSSILIETNELTFSNASSAISIVPVGSILKVQVEKIDTEKKWISTSMYQLTEKLLNEKFTKKGKEGVEEKQVTTAHVIKIEKENVQFILDWADPKIGFLPIITVFSNKLPKKPEEYTIGEKVLISVYRGKKINNFSYPNMSEKLELKFEDGKKLSGLGYSHNILEFNKRMSYDTKKFFKTLDNAPEFHKAIEKIYWLSNRLFLDKFLDIIWFNEVNIKVPINSVIKGIIQEITPQSGMTLLVNDFYNAFLPRSLVLIEFKSDLSCWFHVGDEILSNVIEIKYEKKQLILKQISNEKPKPATPELILKPRPKPVISTSAPSPAKLKPRQSIPQPEISPWEKFKKWLNS